MFSRKPVFLSMLLVLCAPFAQAGDRQIPVGDADLKFQPARLPIDAYDPVRTVDAVRSTDDGGYHDIGAQAHGTSGGTGMAGSIVVQDYDYPPPPPPPDFELASQADIISLAQGSSVSDTIFTIAKNGFSSSVTFSTSGLPNGVTASFAATDASHTQLTLNASATAAAGTSTITITGQSGGLTHSVPISLTITATAATFSIVPGISGSWYLPDQSGHGFNVEVLKGPNQDNGFLAFWYVYDNSGNNLWLVGQGTYAGNTATMDVYQGTGGMFPPYFDKNKIVRGKWGTMTMTFSSCATATAQWNPIVPGYPAGSISLVRLSSVQGLACP